MAGGKMTFPILDLSDFTITRGDTISRLNDSKGFADIMVDVLSNYGFLYVVNHGIPNEQIKDILSLGKEFFMLPLETKDKYHRKRPHGYSRYQEETYDVGKPGEHKECFEIYPAYAEKWPTEVRNFEERSVMFMDNCKELSNRVLKLLAAGLNMEEASLFADRDINSKNSFSNARLLHYPPLTKKFEPGEARLGEHFDFGVLSVVCQDDKRGLEVRLRSGEWVEARPIPGTVIILIGMILEKCTSGKLKATLHRIPYPIEKLLKSTRRYSVVYFLHPPKDAVIPEEDADSTATAGDIFKKMYKTTYNDIEI